MHFTSGGFPQKEGTTTTIGIDILTPSRGQWIPCDFPATGYISAQGRLELV